MDYHDSPLPPVIMMMMMMMTAMIMIRAVPIPGICIGIGPIPAFFDGIGVG